MPLHGRAAPGGSPTAAKSAGLTVLRRPSTLRMLASLILAQHAEAIQFAFRIRIASSTALERCFCIHWYRSRLLLPAGS